MTTKNTKEQETLSKNMENMLKWFQDTSLEMIETQSKQLQVANEMFAKTLNNYFDGIKKSDFNVSKEMIETMQKNTKNFIQKFNEASETIMGFGQKKGNTYSTDFLNKMTDIFNNQLETMTTINKNYFDSLNTSTTFGPLFDKLKVEFDTNFKTSKQKMQEIIDSYTKVKLPTTETTKKVLEDLNKNMTVMAENNFKLWLELLSNTNKSNPKNNNSETPTNKPFNGKTNMSKTI